MSMFGVTAVQQVDRKVAVLSYRGRQLIVAKVHSTGWLVNTHNSLFLNKHHQTSLYLHFFYLVITYPSVSKMEDVS